MHAPPAGFPYTLPMSYACIRNRHRMLKNARLFIALLFCVSAPLVLAQSSIREDASRHQWYLDAGETSYVIGVNDQGMLQSLYWGPQLKPGAALPATRM